MHRSYRFSLVTLLGEARPKDNAIEMQFFVTDPGDLADLKRKVFLSPRDIAAINPNTRTCPIFRSSHDAELSKHIYKTVPVLVNEVDKVNPWGLNIYRMLHGSGDSKYFLTKSSKNTTSI